MTSPARAPGPTLLALLLLALFAAQPQPAAAAAKAKWAMLVFLCDTNDLYPYGARTMAQLAKVGSTPDLHLVVLRGYMKKDRPSEKIYVRKGKAEVVETLPKVDMGDWRNLVEFVRWSNARYPAERTLVVLWNHGAGWWEGGTDPGAARGGPGAGAADLMKGICFDDLSGNHITNFQLRKALLEIKAVLGKPVDVLGMDACLMQMIEIAGELRGAADHVVAAEDVEPGKGWPYDRVARLLAQRPQAGARECAAGIVREHQAAYLAAKEIESTTCSALDLSRADAAVGAVESVARALRERLADPTLREAVEAAAKGVRRFDEKDNADLPHFLMRLRARVKEDEPGFLLDAALRTLNGPDGLVVANLNTGSVARGSHGVAVYLPRGTVDPSYRGATMFARGPWGDLLRDLRP